jgi:hypothetical protein
MICEHVRDCMESPRKIFFLTASLSISNLKSYTRNFKTWTYFFAGKAVIDQ